MITKEQATGQLREILTAAGTALTTWGFTDGHNWAPVIGSIVVLYSLTWGFLHHKDPAKPGVISWSLLRKAVNIVGSAAATYGLTTQTKIDSLDPLLAALGPILAMSSSYVSNRSDSEPTDNPGSGTLLLLLSLSLFFTSCATAPLVKTTPDNSIMIGYKVPDYPGTVWAGMCADDSFAVEWDAVQPDGRYVAVRATRSKKGVVKVSYLLDNVWVAWSKESGVVIGSVPRVDGAPTRNVVTLPVTSDNSGSSLDAEAKSVQAVPPIKINASSK